MKEEKMRARCARRGDGGMSAPGRRAKATNHLQLPKLDPCQDSNQPFIYFSEN